MTKSFLIMLVAMVGMTLQSKAQSVEEQADRIGLVGYWKMTEMYGLSNGEKFHNELDGSNFYIFKSNGSCQYSTNDHKIANAKWTLKDKMLHMWGNDTANDPDGIDYTFKLVMVTPEKLVLMLGDDEEYVYTDFRKANVTMRSVGKTTKRQSQNTKRR